MKRFMTLLSIMALVALMGAAQAGDDGKCATKAAAGTTCDKGAAKVQAAGATCDKGAAAQTAGKTCGSSAAVQTAGAAGTCGDAAKASACEARATKMAFAAMHECCAAAAQADKGCCGQDAAAVKASFATHLVEAKAQVATLDSMHPCCAEAVQANKGCCGKDAAALHASYEHKVEEAKAQQVSSAGGCSKPCAGTAAAGSCGDKGAKATQTKVATSAKSSES
jgi:hypothetical protein